MSQFRGFIAVDIDVFPKLLEFEKEIKDTGANIKLVEPENVHITLKFLGDTNEDLIEEIDGIINDATQNIEPFNIKLNGAGVFPNQNYIKVIWLGIKQWEQLEGIAQKIDEQLHKMGFKKEKRKFSAHLTIARVRSAQNKDKLLQIIEKYKDFEFAEINVDSIKLKKSELTPKGPIYTNLKDVRL
ncbi:MAG: RNA 2',3'-cyclic phosphodiesterase [Thermoplasmatales archaeon]|nr:RNA 2',3'-cyclic phosphodiesterase [Thermoplasmatales archaeon]